MERHVDNGFQIPDPRKKALSECPLGCSAVNSFTPIIAAVPPPFSTANAFCRCMKCLSSWDVDKHGNVLHFRRGVDALDTVPTPPELPEKKE